MRTQYRHRTTTEFLLGVLASCLFIQTMVAGPGALSFWQWLVTFGALDLGLVLWLARPASHDDAGGKRELRFAPAKV